MSKNHIRSTSSNYIFITVSRGGWSSMWGVYKEDKQIIEID